MGIKHPFVSGKTDSGDATLVQPSNWNASHAIDADGITIPANAATPASPAADNVTLFCTEIANRAMPAFVGPSGLDTALQPLLARNKIAYWSPSGNSTTAPTAIGMNALTVQSNNGTTYTARNIATTNILTRIKRIAVISQSGTNATIGGVREANAQYTTGTGTGLGGFHFVARFATSDAATVTGARTFVGFTSATNAITNVDPATIINCVGVAQLSTDATQWYIVYGGSAAQTAIPLGTALGAPTLTTTAFELSLFSSPSANGVVHYEMLNIGTGVKVVGTLTPATVGVQTPASTTLLAARLWRTNNQQTTVTGLDLISIYIETDQ